MVSKISLLIVGCCYIILVSSSKSGVFLPKPVFGDSDSADRPLKIGYYKSTCPEAETIVNKVVKKWYNKDRSIPAALLHLQFHDCFVNGCDASILIDSTPQTPSEKAAGPSATLRGFDLLDAVKAELEAHCPSRVSCADIITLATRDSVVLAGGPTYALPTGRLDGIVSKPSDVKLPGPTLKISQAFTHFFQPLGFTLTEMVTLLGAHTVGMVHCSSFKDRLSDFKGTNRPDPSMDPNLVATLRKTCFVGNNSNPTTFLDQNTSFVVDASYYKELRQKKGVLSFDQELYTGSSTRRIVSSFAKSELLFRKRFGAVMVKMGNLVGSNDGEVRKNCRVFNVPKKFVGGGRA
ncbi:Peroxidase 44 [Linum perenne]